MLSACASIALPLAPSTVIPVMLAFPVPLTLIPFSTCSRYTSLTVAFSPVRTIAVPVTLFAVRLLIEILSPVEIIALPLTFSILMFSKSTLSDVILNTPFAVPLPSIVEPFKSIVISLSMIIPLINSPSFSGL